MPSVESVRTTGTPSARSAQGVLGVLDGLAADRATGSLRLGRAGVLYLTDGRVTYAQSAAAPRLEDLLVTGAGVPAGLLRSVRRAAAAELREGTARGPLVSGGERLVEQGLLTRGELEFCVLSAVLDAAYFLLGTTTGRPRFRPGERHWLGPQWHVDVTGLLRECERRRERLERTWPSAELDTLPVVPLRRIGAQRVMLSPLQWEVLVGADRTATPAELARRLGRPAYSVLLAVRQLASSGLLQRPASTPAPAPAPPPAPGAAPGPGSAPGSGSGSGSGSGEVPGEPDARDSLPRRARGATDIPHAPAGSMRTAEWLPRANGDPADVNLLIRLRNALEALT
ncbi:DUF4388 domain-containing protein [Streptosporangium sp. NPDC050855]|uniref:DUF4388 domain-containing protein n=1 Tax=Streptosporangium sp. NPDC050855 TaxID=3366194 RepID=UPI003793539A